MSAIGTTNARREIQIPAGDRRLPGELSLPASATGVVLFVHGSGSSRRSPRNISVARTLNEAGVGTLLFDLLTPGEAGNRSLVFDIPFLAERLDAATRWVRQEPATAGLEIGYFGASTGAGAALWAAGRTDADADSGGRTDTRVGAVVSRGGRPDLAGERLSTVEAPTLLIVGGHDPEVLRLNIEAERRMRCPTHLEVVAGATHLFEEPGTLERVAQLAAEWFSRYLGR